MEANRKTAKVHMLPTASTKERSHIHRTRSGELFYTSKPKNATGLERPIVMGGSYGKGHYLYFTTDEDEFDIDEWVVFNNEEVFQIGAISQDYLFKDVKQYDPDLCRKIIATTDPKLTEYCKGVHRLGEGCNLTKSCNYPNCRVAEPSQDFIKAYCEQGGIDEVDVEYEFVKNKWKDKGLAVHKCIPKVDPIHNTITTHRIEEKMYSKEVLAPMFKKVFIEGGKCAYNFQYDFNIDKWIEENL